MPPLLQFWLPVALAVALTALAMHEGARRTIQTVLYVSAAIVATAAITWQVATQVITVRPPQRSVSRPILKGWGTNAPFCAAILDGSALSDFQDKYGVTIVCGVADATMDKFEDRRITISSLFGIHPGDIEIMVPYSKEMQDAVKKLNEEALKSVRVPKGTTIGVTTTIWYEVAILPKGTETSALHRLSDVARVGGKVLSQDHIPAH